MKNLIILIIFSCQIKTGIAQNKSGYTVIFSGGGVFAKFSGDTSRPLTGQLYSNNIVYFSTPAVSNICDSATGRLLFVCNGARIWDTLGNLMENGDSLIPPKLYVHNTPPVGLTTQCSLILPKGSNGQYYVFIVAVSDSTYNNVWNGNVKTPADLLLYNVVDMNANAGMGKVMQKNVPLIANTELARVGMMACRHANGYDWWLLKQGFDTNMIHTFLVTKDTIELKYMQGFSEPRFGLYDAFGQSCFSNDGSRYAFATGGVNSQGDKLFIADFDRCTGILSNPKSLHAPLHSSNTILDSLFPGDKDTSIIGLAFSPNDKFLYVSKTYNIYQFELDEPDSSLAWYHVQHGPDTVLQYSGKYGHLSNGIDKRIYIGKQAGGGNQNSVIDFPDLKGGACGFCKKCLRMDTTQWGTWSLANMPDFNLGPLLPCWPLGSSEIGDKRLETLVVYPNPSSTYIDVNYEFRDKRNSTIEMYNAIGQQVYSSQLLHLRSHISIDVRHLSKGMYYLRCLPVGQSGENEVKKVIIE
jgi:hypothetical protein